MTRCLVFSFLSFSPSDRGPLTPRLPFALFRVPRQDRDPSPDRRALQPMCVRPSSDTTQPHRRAHLRLPLCPLPVFSSLLCVLSALVAAPCLCPCPWRASLCPFRTPRDRRKRKRKTAPNRSQTQQTKQQRQRQQRQGRQRSGAPQQSTTATTATREAHHHSTHAGKRTNGRGERASKQSEQTKRTF